MVSGLVFCENDQVSSCVPFINMFEQVFLSDIHLATDDGFENFFLEFGDLGFFFDLFLGVVCGNCFGELFLGV